LFFVLFLKMLLLCLLDVALLYADVAEALPFGNGDNLAKQNQDTIDSGKSGSEPFAPRLVGLSTGDRWLRPLGAGAGAGSPVQMDDPGMVRYTQVVNHRRTVRVTGTAEYTDEWYE
jgi:hypothetical protein